MSIRVGVIGGGQMGAGIAEVCARSGLEVVVVENGVVAARAALGRISASIGRAQERGKIVNAEDVLARLTVTSDFDALHDRSLAIEAIVEDEASKVDVFRRLDRVVTDETAVLASNTSSVPIMRLAMSTQRPENVIGIHFFNPATVLSLVEVVPSIMTGDETLERARCFVEDVLEKKAIRCMDRAGFVVNALLIPFVLSAVRMLESGVATRDDIDEGLKRGCAHPQGPLALADLIGIDTVRSISDSLYDEFKEPLYAPPPLLLRMVEAGLLGRKSGKGFYEYA
jgi:3-hydroxybutyryl-CoA dehydrogenase